MEREQAIGQMIAYRKVLQQWWEPHWIEGKLGVPKGEWRDVPLEEEQ